MLGEFKNFTLQMVAGANVATVTMLLWTGFADYVNPVEHPVLAQAGLAFPIFLLLQCCCHRYMIQHIQQLSRNRCASLKLSCFEIKLYLTPSIMDRIIIGGKFSSCLPTYSFHKKIPILFPIIKTIKYLYNLYHRTPQ